METRFPLESALVAVLIDSIVSSLDKTIYRPEDTTNNAEDDLAGLDSNVRDTQRRETQ